MAVILFGSCATVFTGTTDTIHFESKPSNAVVEINGTVYGNTPCDIEIDRQLGQKSARIRLDGYEPKDVILKRSFNPVAVIDIFTILGALIDVGSGSITRFDPKAYSFELEKKAGINTPITAINPITENTDAVANYVGYWKRTDCDSLLRIFSSGTGTYTISDGKKEITATYIAGKLNVHQVNYDVDLVYFQKSNQLFWMITEFGQTEGKIIHTYNRKK